MLSEARPFMLQSPTLAVFPGALFILFAAINAIRRGYAPAKVFLTAWAFLLLGTALYRFLPGPRAVSAETAQSTP